MGAPGSGTKAAEQPAAETLLNAFKTISAGERRRHASVLNYWLSIRGDKEFPPLHDLDPLELSDAGPNSILLELISGGHDAEIRHMGEALRDADWPERIMDADSPSILACIAKKLPIVAISRDFLAFEDEFSDSAGKTRCWITLLPLSAGGAWVDYVYALVSVDSEDAKPAAKKKGKAADPVEEIEEAEQSVAEEAEAIEEPVAEDEDVAGEAPEEADEPLEAQAEPQPQETDADEEALQDEPSEALDEQPEAAEEQAEEPAAATVAKAAPGFSKLLDSLAGLTGFYGSQPVKVEPVIAEPEPEAEVVQPEEEAAAAEPQPEESAVDEEPAEEPAVEEPAEEEPAFEEPAEEEPAFEEPAAIAEPEKPASKKADRPAEVLEGSLQSKLENVRAKADEARQARLAATAALCAGLGAAYDFALDAESEPEEYLRLVESKGLKIQLRAPMKPVVKLAFDGLADAQTIADLEAVLAWALKQDLPRGTLPAKIEQAGGLDQILN
jgi:hypothetical protein